LQLVGSLGITLGDGLYWL